MIEGLLIYMAALLSANFVIGILNFLRVDKIEAILMEILDYQVQLDGSGDDLIRILLQIRDKENKND